MKTGLLLMKNVLTTLVKSVLVTLRLTAATSVTDAAIQKNTILDREWQNWYFQMEI